MRQYPTDIGRGVVSAASVLSLAALLTLFAAHPAYAQSSSVFGDVRDAITPARLDTHARVITSHQRPSGSEGENAAIDYIVETLRAAGVPVDVHEFMAYTSNPVSASVTVPGTDFAPEAITMSFSGATDGIEGVALDMGSLGDLPELELGTGERLVLRDASGFEHVRGKVVLVTGQPRNIPTVALEELGAAAAIFINPEERLNDLIVTSTWGTPSLMSAHRLPTLPTAQITRSAGERLRSMMADGEVTVRVATEVDQGWKPLRLPVARIMPPGAPEDTPYVLLGGHIDGWYYAGTDEGAANAAMLEMALRFHENRAQMRRGLAVAWWPGHSNARYGGATWFADNFFEELRTRGLAYLNIDGVGQMGAKRFSVSASPALTEFGRSVVADRVDGVAMASAVPAGRPGRNSDQAFNGIGLPLLQFNHTRLAEDGGYWWWHTPDDTYDKIDFEVLRQDTELYVAAISGMVSEDALPIDIVAEIDALSHALREREEESGGALDLSEARRRAALLADTWASSAMSAGAVRDRTLDADILRVLRPIHRIMFAPGSDYHPDPGIYSGPLPGLEPARALAEEQPSSDRYGFAMAQLIRETNRILEALDEATRAAEEVIRRRTRS